MSKILVISTSLRINSNSEVLANEFVRGAKDAGNDVEVVSLKKKNIAFCQGCLACGKLGHCVINDDAIEIAKKMHDADAICFATPIYYYEMSGQMKTLLDRCNSLYYSDYHFRNIFILTCAAEDEETTPERAVSGLCGWIDCYENAKLSGSVFAGGVNDGGDIKNHKSLQAAYELGKSIKA